VSDPTNPSNSHLLLADDRNGIRETLTVRDLEAASLKMARMAYLSACSTADNAARDLDDVIHLASAFFSHGMLMNGKLNEIDNN
jgi:CHAT domain-containing protein